MLVQADTHTSLHTNNPQMEIVSKNHNILKRDFYLPDEHSELSLEKSVLTLHDANTFSINESRKTVFHYQFLEIITKDLKLYEFLQDKNLLNFFPDIFSRITQFFPQNKIKIRLVQDIEEGYFTVFVTILTKDNVTNALKQTNKMFKGWNLLKNKLFNKYINISTKSATSQEFIVRETISEEDLDDLEVLELYVEPKPVRKYKVKGKIKSRKKGEIQFFPDEFEI